MNSTRDRLRRTMCAAMTGVFVLVAPVACAGVNGNNGGNTDNEWGKHEHKYEITEIQEATCEEHGKKIIKCECGEIKSEEIIAPLGHEWGDYFYNNNETCVNNGTETATCKRCGVTNTREKINSKLGHDYGEYVYNNDATCTEDGTETKICNRCNDEVTRVKENTKTGHRLQQTRKDPTCTEDGYIIEQCLSCDYYKYEIIKSEGHKYKYGECEVCEERDYITPTKELKYENNKVTRSYNDDIMNYIVIVIAEENDNNKITEIDIEAFHGCNMEEIIIPESITVIGASAFDGCIKLKEVKIPSKVTSIDIGTFYGCESLNKVTIPTSVTYIDELAFGECGEMTIYYQGTRSEWNDITLCDDWDDGSDITVVFLGES